MYKLTSPLDGLRSPFGAQRGGALQRIIALFGDPAATGWVYDNQDLTTMFQDVAGTVPVTAPGQRVRLQLDKSWKGNHRRQPSGDASAPILGRHPAGGRRNLLTRTEDFSNAAWAKPNIVLSNLGDGVWKLTPSTASNVKHLTQNVPVPGGQVTTSVLAKPDGYTKMRLITSTGVDALFDLVAGAAIVTVGTGSASIAPAADGFFMCSMISSPTVGGKNLDIRVVDASGNSTFVGDGVSGILIRFPQLELGATATPYQRVTIADDCTEAGVPSRWYLRADGADDWMETSAFAWGADEVSLCTGVRKLSDAGQACVVAIGLNGGPPGVNNENALMLAPVSAGSPTYWWRASGTVTPVPAAISGFPAPNSAVVTARAKVATDFQSLRVNGGIPVVESADMGLGTFGTGTVAYFFRRGGTTAPFNGFEYANIGINRLLTPADLALVEGYVTGVTL